MRTKIEVRQVSKAYASEDGSLQVVDGVDFSVGDGDSWPRRAVRLRQVDA
jgi:hypothetical protein